MLLLMQYVSILKQQVVFFTGPSICQKIIEFNRKHFFCATIVLLQYHVVHETTKVEMMQHSQSMGIIPYQLPITFTKTLQPIDTKGTMGKHLVEGSK